jgi:hypothetical protein
MIQHIARLPDMQRDLLPGNQAAGDARPTA